MKPRILTYRFNATHDWITPLASINSAAAITDFDALVVDPEAASVEPITAEAFFRRQKEISDLLQKKDGLIIYTLRPNAGIPNPGISGQAPDRYWMIRQAATDVYQFLISRVQVGEGSLLRRTIARGTSSGYFEILKGTLQFASYLQCSEEEVAAKRGKVFAVNSVGYPIAVEFPLGTGTLCFVPVSQNVTADRMGAAIVKMVRAHRERSPDTEVPDWAPAIEVPGSKVYEERISALAKQKDEIGTEIELLQGKVDSIRAFTGLLYGYGKVVLERQVRASFRLFGFSVPEPEEYKGEWDVDLTDPSSRTAIGEVEGAEGFVDVDKYRQLLDYVEAETLEGRDHKGILIGNGFRLFPPDATERQQQFSDHALRGAARNSFCLFPTTEMFKAVCAVLENPNDETLKTEIRDSILKQVGVWTFVRPITAERAADQRVQTAESAPAG